MPILHVPKPPYLQDLAIYPSQPVGIVLQSAYDLVLEPYGG